MRHHASLGRHPGLSAFVVTCVAAGLATAQCAPTWLPGMPVPGVHRSPFDTPVTAACSWDPDGPGPLPAVLAVAGSFDFAGDQVLRDFATYDRNARRWAPIGTGGPTGPGTKRIHAMAALPNGDLVVAGRFTAIAGVAANGVARWDGSTWHPLGAGLTTTVNDLAVLPNGDLAVAVDGGDSVQRWNGTTWQPVGAGLTGSSATALLALPNGDLIAGGVFAAPLGNVIRFDGTTWTSLGPVVGGTVRSLARQTNGDILVGGLVGTGVSGGTGILRWDGANWTTPAPWQSGNGSVAKILALGNGAFLIAGDIAFAGGPTNLLLDVALWNGTTWQTLGSGLTPTSASSCEMLALMPNGEIVIGGQFDGVDGTGAANIATWNGTAWSSLGAGPVGAVRARAWLPNGDLVVGGDFTRMGDAAVRYLARFDGTHWSGLGVAFDGPVTSLLRLPNGDLVVGGAFTAPFERVALYDGTSWKALGYGLPGATLASVQSLVRLANGDLLAGGTGLTDGVARWDGGTWHATGNAPDANCLLQRSDGTVFVGTASGVRQWDGNATWTDTGFPFNSAVMALAGLANGDLLAAGTFNTAGGVQANGIARWNGTLWWSLGAPTGLRGRAVVLQPDGDVLVGTDYASEIWRWSGSQWSTLATGSGGTITMLVQEDDGDLMLGGTFVTLDGELHPSLARLTTPCPAMATAFGQGCSGTGGTNVLTAQNLPWLGSVFRSTVTGLPANGLAIGLRGLASATTPLAAVLPQAGPGCWLYASIDTIDAFVPAAGAVTWAWPLPNTPSLAGLVLFEQFVALDLAGGSLTAATSSNRLSLTLGAF